MSDDESFVILGSSPMSSLEQDAVKNASNVPSTSAVDSHTYGSSFTSLKSSQMTNLGDALEAETQSSDQEHEIPPKMAESLEADVTKENQQDMAASELWSTAPPQAKVEENLMSLSLENYAVKSLTKQQQDMNDNMESSTSANHNHSPHKTTSPPLSADRNLASNFIMGEIDSDVLKTSVYSQFPSISTEGSAEDVLKLQNMITEYSALKTTIKKANNTMKLFYNNSIQWKEKLQTMEEEHKQQLEACQKEIEELRRQNKETATNFQMQIEALEVARREDREETVREISEKNALLENMRAQILKLEQQQSSFEFVHQDQNKMTQNDPLNKVYVAHEEECKHEIKNLERQLSEMLASNLDLKDVQKQYINELNCLRVNLTAAEILIGKNHTEIAQLTALNREKEQQVQKLDNTLIYLQAALADHKERIVLLETQNELHRSDFEIEKQSRETAIKEKQQLLQDLRSLQKRNRELIEEHQNMAEAFQSRLAAAAACNGPQKAEAHRQEPVKVKDPLQLCAICNKPFKSLTLLMSHVVDEHYGDIDPYR